MPVYRGMKSRKGQSTIEYILVVAAVLAVTIAFGGKDSFFKNALNAAYDTNINSMLNMAERILQ